MPIKLTILKLKIIMIFFRTIWIIKKAHIKFLKINSLNFYSTVIIKNKMWLNGSLIKLLHIDILLIVKSKY